MKQINAVARRQPVLSNSVSEDSPTVPPMDGVSVRWDGPSCLLTKDQREGKETNKIPCAHNETPPRKSQQEIVESPLKLSLPACCISNPLLP